MNKKITFCPIQAQGEIQRRLYNDLKPIIDLVDVLKKYNKPHNINDLFQIVVDGADKELNIMMDEIEHYIKNTKMPIYLQDYVRRKAVDSLNTDFADEVRPILARWDSTLQPEDIIEDEEGNVLFTEHYKTKLTAYYTRELPTDIVEILPDIHQFLKLYKKIDNRINAKKFIDRFFSFQIEKTQEEIYSYLSEFKR